MNLSVRLTSFTPPVFQSLASNNVVPSYQSNSLGCLFSPGGLSTVTAKSGSGFPVTLCSYAVAAGSLLRLLPNFAPGIPGTGSPD